MDMLLRQEEIPTLYCGQELREVVLTYIPADLQNQRLMVYQAVSRLEMDMVLLQEELITMLFCGQELRKAMLT
jgi:hypothetical protein